MAAATGPGVTTLGLDVTQAVAEATRYEDKLDGLTQAILNVGNATVISSNKGKTLQASFETIDAEGNKVSSTFDRVKARVKGVADQFVLTAQSINRTKTVLKDFNDLKIQAKQLTTEDLRKTLTRGNGNAGNATPAETGRLNSAIKQVVSNIGVPTDVAQIADIFTRLNAGATSFTAKERIIVEQLQAAKRAADDLGNSFLKAAARGDSVKIGPRQSTTGGTVKPPRFIAPQSTIDDATKHATDTFNRGLKNGTAQQIQAFNTALVSSLKLLKDGTVSLDQFKKGVDGIRANSISKDLDPAIVALNTRLTGLRTAFDAAGQSGGKAGQQIFLSWQNVVRIFESSLLYSAIGKLQAAFGEALSSAVDYSKQIGLVQTISQDAGVSTQEWAIGLRRVSDELGLPIADVSAAAYEALSNQVAKGADAFQFLGTSAQYARTTQSTLTDSVNLISSALNSFNLDASKSEEVARSFFTTIDLGRVKTPELANSFGRIATQAAQLGISLQETNASISVLTRQGIKANESFTLIGNVFQKLLKPTIELQKIFDKLGIPDAEAGISAFGGYVPLLLQIKQAAEAAGIPITKLFDEIRGRRGFENIVGDGGKAIAGDIAAQNNNTGAYDQAKKIVAETFGQRFDQEINKVKNFFVQDVGGTFLESVVRLTEKWGGLANAIINVLGVIKQLVPFLLLAYSVSQIVKTIAAVQTFLTALQAAKTAYVSLTAAAALYGSVAGAAAAVATAGVSVLAGLVAAYFVANTEFGDKATKSIRELKDEYSQVSNTLLATEQKNADERTKAFETGLNGARTAFAKFASEIRVGLQRVAEGFNIDAANIGDALKAQFDLVTGTVRSQIQELEGSLKRITSAIARNKQEIAGAPERQSREIFDRNIRVAQGNASRGARDDTVPLTLARIKELQGQATKDILDTKNPEKVYKTLEEIQTLITNIAKETDKHPIFGGARNGEQFRQNFRQQVGPDGKLQNIPNGLRSNERQTGTSKSFPNQTLSDQLQIQLGQFRLNILNKQNAALEKQKELEAEKLVIAKADYENLQQAQKRILEFSAFDKQGGLLDKFKGEGGAEKAVAELKEQQDKLQEILGKIGGSVDTQIHTSAESAKQLVDLLKVLDSQSKNVANRVTASQDLRKADTSLETGNKSADTLKQSQGVVAGQAAENKRAFQDSLNNAKLLTDLLAQTPEKGKSFAPIGFASGSNKAELSGLKTSIADNAKELKKIFEDPNFGNGQTIAEATKKYQELNANVQKANKLYGGGPTERFQQSELKKSESPNLPATTIVSAEQSLKNFISNAQSSKAAATQIEANLKAIEDKIKDLTTTEEGLKNPFAGLPAAAAAGGNGIVAGLEPGKQAVIDTEKAAANASAALSTLLQLQDKVKAAPAAPASSAAPSSESEGTGSDVEFNARGGRVGYYAGGGFIDSFLRGDYAKGTDNVPVMATKGEYIMDKSNTQRFLPLLQSMSAGRYKAPSHGPSNSTTVGDINITVQGGGTDGQTVRNIGSGLRRGIRQGVVRLN